MDKGRIRLRRSFACMIICCLAVMLTGCMIDSEEAEEQESWADVLNNTFTDDHFEYLRPAFNTIGGQSPGCAIFRSENYPDSEITVRDTGDELITDYYKIVYDRESEEYFKNYFADRFECDDCSVNYWNNDQDATPICRMTAEEYIRDYVDLNTAEVIIYRKDGDFPDTDDMKDILTDICKERDEICVFTVYFCTEETSFEEAENNCDLVYYVSMTERNNIKRIYYRNKDGDSHDLLWEYSW